MDESLDDYISKSNFKVQIGNPNFKGNKPRKFGNQTIKLGGPQVKPLANVSVTVPAVQKSPGNVNKTNQIRDAREKIHLKGKPQDARQKIQIRPQSADFQVRAQSGDARQKLTMMRSQAGPQDARAKLQAKKQQAQQNMPGPDGFMLTRTVSNSGGQPVQHGPPGNFQVTKTLTKIMPPGYEGLVEGPPAPQPMVQPVQPIQVRRSAKQRLGQRGGSGPVSVTRTVPTNLPAPGQPPPGHHVIQGPPQGHMGHPLGPPPPQHIGPITHPPPQFPPNGPHIRYGPPPVHNAGAAPMPPHVQQGGHVVYIHGPPPPGHAPLPPHHLPPPGHQGPPPGHLGPPPGHLGPPPPGHMPPPPHENMPPHLQGQAPPPARVIMTAPNPQPAPRPEGPPYPVDDNIPIKRSVGQEVNRPPLPIIQVQNDQYKPPPQQQQQQYIHYAPPSQSYPTNQQPYTEATPTASHQQEPYYTQRDTSLRRTIPNRDSMESKPIIKTIVNETAHKSPDISSPPSLKRKSPAAAPASGPLKFSSTNTIPVLSMDMGKELSKSGVVKYSKPATQVSDEPVVKKSKQQEPAVEEIISPIQGFKVVITNLHVTVTQDDVIELFGAIGAVKKVRLAKPGTAEVHYVKKEDALEATKTYHDRELDGQPMVVKLVTPTTAKIKEPPEKLPPSVKPLATGPLKLSKKPAGMAKLSEKKGVDVGVLHKALFKTGSNSSAKPVTFTVNI